MLELGVNIDHVATIRQARRTYEPDPVWAAAEAELGGADGITVHLREDRRHIQDHDVERIRSMCHTRLNLEMAATDQMVQIALRIKPKLAMLVPEGRTEVTTERGLDVAGQAARMKDVVSKLRGGGIMASAFIDADPNQIDAAADAGFQVCEIHTGPYAHAFHDHGGNRDHPAVEAEIQKVAEGGRQIRLAGMRFNAGHALNYQNVSLIAALPGLRELHIGHSIISRAVFVGLREAVREMKRLMENATLVRNLHPVQPERPPAGVLNYRGGPPHV
jgi:pyridoxine 5-phosphate synthase